MVLQVSLIFVCLVTATIGGAVNRISEMDHTVVRCREGEIFDGVSCVSRFANQQQTIGTILCPTGYSWDCAALVCVRVTNSENTSIKCQSQPDVVPVAQAEIIAPIVPQPQPATPTCEPGWILNGNQCLLSITKETTCLDGYFFEDGQCKRETEGLCAVDQALENGRCIEVINVPIVCPDEFYWTGEQCVHTIPISCESGYELVNGVCEKTTEGSCPIGTSQDNGNCVRQEIFQVTCPEEYSWNGQMCIHTTEVFCEFGSHLVDGKCVQVDFKDSDLVCAEGRTIVNGECISSVQYCPEFFELIDNQCVRKALEDCPTGYENENGVCVKKPCCGTIVQPKCPQGYEYQNNTCVIIGTALSCPEGYVLENNRCIKSIILMPTCPEGFYFDEYQCVPNKASPPTVHPLCEEGYIFQFYQCVLNNTIPTPTVPSTPENNEPYCPEGYSFENNQCITNKPVIIDPICPIGYFWQGSQCYRTIISEPPATINPICPIEYELHGLMCILIDFHKHPNLSNVVNPICQHNYTLQGKVCVLNYEKGTPLCPQGFVFEFNRCVQNQTIAKPGYCPVGFVFQNNHCIREEDKQTLCKGTIVNGVCQTSLVCPEGSVFYNNACYKRPIPLPPSYIDCDIGYTYINGECVLNPTSDPDSETISTTTEHKTLIRPTTSHHMPPQQQICPPCDTQPCPPCSSVITGKGDGNGEISLTNTINNNNEINHPTNITTINENHVIVHLGRGGVGKSNCGDVTIVRNNNGTAEQPTTTSLCNSNATETESVSGNDEYDEVPAEELCCEVITPRQCKRIGDEWKCTHKKYQRCGSFCTQPRVYLKPRNSQYRSDVLTIPPPPRRFERLMSYHLQRYNSGYDCSGCIAGGYRCSNECFTYDCSSTDCGYIDQGHFCNSYGGDGCAEDDGYYV